MTTTLVRGHRRFILRPDGGIVVESLAGATLDLIHPADPDADQTLDEFASKWLETWGPRS